MGKKGKYLKTGILLSLIMACLIFLSACEDSLEYVALKIISYPDKIVYVKDVDTQLSAEGFEVQTITRGGHKGSLVPSALYEAGRNIDFSKEGVQIVKVKLNNELYVEFPIQIVSKEWLKETLEEAAEY